MKEFDETKQAYRRTFSTTMGSVVLVDLAEFCNFLATTQDPFEEGKRDAFLHILDMYGTTISEAVIAIQQIPSHEKKSQEEADNG